MSLFEFIVGMISVILALAVLLALLAATMIRILPG